MRLTAAILASVFTCAECWSPGPHAHTPRTHLAPTPIGLRGSQIFLHPAAAADSALVWRHALPPAEREFGIPQLLGYLWPAGGPRIFGVCKAKLMVSVSLALLFAAKMFVVKVAAFLQP